MNAKKAREIVAEDLLTSLKLEQMAKDAKCDTTIYWAEAKGYLAALEGPEVKAKDQEIMILKGDIEFIKTHWREKWFGLQKLLKSLVEVVAQYQAAVDCKQIITPIFHCYKSGKEIIAAFRKEVSK